MPRETKEQKDARLAAEQAYLLAKRIAYRATIPAKLVELQALASAAGVSTNVKLTPTCPKVEFYRWNCDSRNNDFEETLTYDSEQHEVEYVELRMKGFKEKIDARAARHKLAQDTFNTLTQEQKEALKEFIRQLL